MSDQARHVMDAILQVLPDADGAGDRRLRTAEDLLAVVGRKKMPLSDAIHTLADMVDGIDGGSINANVHGLPLEFFARQDVSNVESNLTHGKTEVYLTGNLDIGGHSFSVFSRHFPVEASE